MGVTTTQTNKPFNPRGNDQSPLAYNRAKLFSGKALDFDGVNDTLSTDYAPSSNIQTTAYWVKLDSLTTNYALGGFVGSSDQFGLYYWGNESNKNFGFNSWNNDSYGVTLPNFVNDWFHIVAEYNFTDFTQSKIFVNGQELIISQTRNTTLQRTTASRTFKLDSPIVSTQEMNGKISGVKVFEGSLTAAQVADLYNNPEKVVPTGVADSALKLWLPMQEGAGTTAYDGSGNGNHGTISGATWTHGIGAPVAQTAVIDWNKAKNDIGRSQEFDNAYWSTGNITVTANATTAPDGTTTADKLVATSTSGSNAEIFRNIGLSTNNSISVFAKYDTAQWVTLGTNRILERTVWFDVINGVVGTESTGYTGEITEYPNGWYKLDVIIGSGATAQAYWDLSIANADGAIGVTAGKSVFAWGAYANKSGTTIGPYIATLTDSAITSEVLLPQGLTTGRDITGVNLFENVRKQGALNLDGNSWAEVHDNASLDITDAITLEAWVYNDGSSFDGFLGRWFTTGNNRSVMIYESTSNEARMIVAKDGANGFNANGTLISGWNHIVGTCDDTEIKIYINGVKGTDGTAPSGSIHVSSYPYEIGRYNSSTAATYTNQIAQPRIYNRALTAEEVERNYNAGKNIYK